MALRLVGIPSLRRSTIFDDRHWLRSASQTPILVKGSASTVLGASFLGLSDTHPRRGSASTADGLFCAGALGSSAIARSTSVALRRVYARTRQHLTSSGSASAALSFSGARILWRLFFLVVGVYGARPRRRPAFGAIVLCDDRRWLCSASLTLLLVGARSLARLASPAPLCLTALGLSETRSLRAQPLWWTASSALGLWQAPPLRARPLQRSASSAPSFRSNRPLRRQALAAVGLSDTQSRRGSASTVLGASALGLPGAPPPYCARAL